MTTVAARQLLPEQWRVWLALGLAVTALYVGFAAAFDKLLPRWQGVWDYSHGYLVCGMVVWLLVERIKAHSVDRFNPSFPGLIALGLVSALYALLQLIDLTNGMFAVLPLALLAILWMVGGMSLLRRGALPVLLLLFAIPFWDRLGPLLQDIATVVVRDMLRGVGIPAYSEGHVIRTARAAVEVAAACSGMTFLLASLTLSCFYAIAWLRSWWSGVLLALVGAIVALVSNWLRIFIITVAGHASDMQHYLIVEDHEFFGWALFSVFMVGLIVFARRLELREAAYAVGEEVSGTHRGRQADTPTGRWTMQSYAIVGLALVVLIGPALVRPETVAERTPIRMSLTLAPSDEWQAVAEESVLGHDWIPASPNPAGVLRQAFTNAGQSIDAYVAFYPVQAPGGKVTSTGHRLAPDWRIVSDRRAAHAGLVVREQEIVQDDRRRLVWSWFHVGGSTTPGLSGAKLREVLGILKGDRSGAVVALSAACEESCLEAGRRLEKFLTISGQALHALSDTNPVRGL